MPVIERTYTIDVCAECGQRVLAAGYACANLHDAGTQVIEVVRADSARGAADALRELVAAGDDLPASGYTPDRVKREARLEAAWRAVRAITGGQS